MNPFRSLANPRPASRRSLLLPCALVLLLVFAVAGCGNKGDLVRPAPPAATAQG
jgi:predicted small lipoprotein YifL